MKVTQIIVVPHMHWDREWYFSTEESEVLLNNNLPEILDKLESDPDYPPFVLDGQSVIIEDFLKSHPHDGGRFKKLAKEGRFKLGPWYSQTDEMAVGAESITRNLLYGLSDSNKFGTPMKIGYVPDSFGQSSQMPMILNQFSIDKSIFWRGLSERKGTNSNQFIWKSKDGSRVFVNQMPGGYATGKYLPLDKVELKNRMDPLLEKFDKFSTTGQAILPNGHDQMPIQKNIKQVVSELNDIYPDRHFIMGNYEDIFDHIEDNSADLDKVSGEFYDGKYERVHRSIQSTRMDLKVMNTRIENKITNLLEPLASIAYKLGFEYYRGMMEEIWKELMKNHAHDSMGACCSDKVHEEIRERYFKAEEYTDRLIDYYKRKITEASTVQPGDDKLTLFNLLPKDENRLVTAEVITKNKGFKLIDADGKTVPFDLINKEIVDPGLIDRQLVAHSQYNPFHKYTIQFNRHFTGVSYEVLAINFDNTVLSLESQNNLNKVIETDSYKMSFNTDGTIDLTNKINGKVYKKVLNMELQGDDGDEYDFSPLPNPIKLYSKDMVNNATINLDRNKYMIKASILYELTVPNGLNQWITCDSWSGNIQIHLDLDIPISGKTIGLKVTVNNQANNVRLRLLVPTEIISQNSTSDVQFGLIDRPNYDPAMEQWKKEEWKERPDSIYPFLSHVEVTDDKSSVAVITNSSREYQIVNSKTIAITLIRGVGVLGKANLVRRPGRPSGINAPTPDSQCIGSLSLNFGLIFSDNPSKETHYGQIAKEFLTPVVSYNQLPNVAMHMNKSVIKVPRLFTLFQENTNLVLSDIKISEDGKKVLVRFYNDSETKLPVLSGNQYTLNEQKVSDIRSTINPNSVGTFEI
ncbi:glycoside hydrolase family 38 C-terminal domain-containing protein [Companilactobacillus halodurans]|uniref:Alpha-mannosidase n=1 Tax=Companilactobacillus halodurans TaxID=2584183 RepID=A0A5P0ZZ58_9LACO|nr:glycoside hydrolase family 38 C-terminal domain-containing protein [Companilactobacillus halodurans]MQS76321.1 alpha-mannosidase [Companilactobacillus halodurans]MQS98175.1 alpha-mannosidase [Companilactobacillus halodurans]